MTVLRVVARALGVAGTLSLLATACTRSAAPPAAQTEAARTAVFRHVRVNGDSVVLGEPLPTAVAVASATPTDTVVALRPGSVAGAWRARVHLTPARRVAAVVFEYGPDSSFEAMVADYTSSLGPPARSRVQRGAEEPADVALWEDASTTFRLVRDPNRSAWTVRAELRDRRAAGTAPPPGEPR